MGIVDGAVIGAWQVVDELVIDCSFVNSSTKPLLVFDPDPPYVLPHENGGLTVAFAWMPVPEDSVVEVVEQAGVFELPALAEVHRIVRLGIPVRQSPAYEIFDVELDPIHRDSTHLQVLAGYTSRPPELKLRQAFCRGKEVQTFDVPFAQQRTALSRQESLAIPMRIRPPVAFPFQPTTAAPLILGAKFHEELKLHYTLCNTTAFGVYTAVPEKPLIAIENGTELRLVMGPPVGSSAPTPAVYLDSGETLEREVPLGVPPFSNKQRPPAGLPQDWAIRTVRTTAVHFAQVYWDKAVASMVSASGPKYPPTLNVPPSALSIQQTEEFTDREARVLLWDSTVK